jgi:hypothetical protein
MFPEAKHCPTRRRKFLVSITITFNIGLDLFPPVTSIGLRRNKMIRAPVPEASVDENSNPRT